MPTPIKNLSLAGEPQKITFSDVTFDSSLDKSHPNKMPFTGVLLVLDEPSQQPPHGSEGHQILVPKEAAEKALKSLIGMGINYKPDLEGHDPKKKIGVISEAWIDGSKVRVKGIIWPKDFPEAVAKLRANRGDLGMSMELGNVYVKDQDEDVWTLEQFHFTGATVLKRDSAAYQHTQLAASAYKVALAAAASAMGGSRGGKEAMGNGSKSRAKDSSQLLARSIAAGVNKAFTDGPMKQLTEAVVSLGNTNTKLLEVIQSVGDGQKVIMTALKASSERADADNDGEIDIDVDAVLHAATHADPTDPTASSSGSASNVRAADASSSGSASMSAADASASDSSADPTSASDQRAASAGDPTAVDGGDPTVPANRIVNKDAGAHAKTQSKSGAKGQLTPGDGNGGVAANAQRKGHITVAAATAKLVNGLNAEVAKQREENRKLRNKVVRMEAQIERFSERQERRSLSPEVINLLEKSGHNPMELMASSVKLSVGAVDRMFDECGLAIDPTTRMALKNQLLMAGLMEQGIVNRQRVM